MFQPELGVSIGVLTQNLTDEWIAALAGSRIRTLEITPYLFGEDRLPTNRAALKTLLRRTPIRVATIHAKAAGEYDFSVLDEQDWRKAVVAFGESLDAAVDLDASIIVVHASGEPIDPAERTRRLAQAKRALAELQPLCKKAGRRIAVELLPRTCLANTVEEVLELIDGLDEDTFGVCLDTNHLMDRHATLSDEVRRLGDRLIATHLSDYHGVDEQHLMPGNGILDWEAFMSALGEIDYAGPFNLESRPEADTPAEGVRCMEECFDRLRALLHTG